MERARRSTTYTDMMRFYCISFHFIINKLYEFLGNSTNLKLKAIKSILLSYLNDVQTYTKHTNCIVDVTQNIFKIYRKMSEKISIEFYFQRYIKFILGQVIGQDLHKTKSYLGITHETHPNELFLAWYNVNLLSVVIYIYVMHLGIQTNCSNVFL